MAKITVYDDTMDIVHGRGGAGRLCPNMLLEDRKMKKCWCCGNVAEYVRGPVRGSWKRVRERDPDTGRRYCEQCMSKISAKESADLAEYARIKKAIMFESAVERLEKQQLDVYVYRDAIDAVEEFVGENPDKFDSSYEMMAAIILCHNRINCHFQYRVGSYQCDICLVDWKVILEVDGERHKGHRERDNDRDRHIVAMLGDEWQIIHIKTDMLDMKAENLVKAIKAVIAKRLKDGVYER